MKKIFKFLLAFLMLFTFVGCDNDKKPSETPNPGDTPVDNGGDNGNNQGNNDQGNGGTETPEPSLTVHKGTIDDPFTVADAINVAQSTGEVATESQYYIKGVVKSVNASKVSQYGNINIDLIDEGGAEVFIAWQIYAASGVKFDEATAANIKAGDVVVICGAIVNYKGNTPETVGYGESYLVSVNGNGGSVTPTPTPTPTETVHKGTIDDPFTVADAIKVAQSTGETATASQYYIQGVVKSVNTSKLSQYGNINIDLIDEGGTEVFIAWQIYAASGVKFDETTASSIKAGDVVVICGAIVNYKGNTPETVGYGESYLVSVNGNSGSVTPTPTPTPTETVHKGTIDDPFTVSDAIKVAKSTGETATASQYYIQGVVKSVNTSKLSQFGNINIDLIDEGGTEVFIAWQIYAASGVQFDEATASMIQAGDVVVICGAIVNYKGNTPETVGYGESYLVSVNDTELGGSVIDEEIDPTIDSKVLSEIEYLASKYNAEVYEDEEYSYSYYMFLEYDNTLEESQAILEELKKDVKSSYVLYEDIVLDYYDEAQTDPGYFMTYDNEAESISIEYATYMDSETNTLVVQINVYYYGE